MDESLASRQPARAHDLRHQLALLAVDIRLCRRQLASGEGDASMLLDSLYHRLDLGLSRAARIAAGQAPPPAGSMRDRAPLVDEIWDRFARAGRLRPGTCRLEVARPWIFPGSEDAIYSLLLNLLENASAAAPEGPVILKIDGRGIFIENGGEAMPEDLAESLRRGLVPAPVGESGQGLGEILRRSRELGLELDVETGNRTRIRLGPAAGPRLLVVEDDDYLRAMLAGLVRRWGFSVDEAASFQEVDAGASPWVAVLADLGLPGEAGDRGLARLKAARPELRTLLLTGAGERGEERFEGVDRVIIKPGLEALESELGEISEKLR